eukprot:g3634.t1
MPRRFRPNAGGGRNNTSQYRVSAKNRFSQSRKKFLAKLKKKKADKDREKRFEERRGKKSNPKNSTTQQHEDNGNAIRVVSNTRHKKVLKFDLKKLQNVELSDANRELILNILDPTKASEPKSTSEENDAAHGVADTSKRTIATIRTSTCSSKPSSQKRSTIATSTSTAPAAVVPITFDVELETLTNMGFVRTKALRALHETGGDVSAAANRLLTSAEASNVSVIHAGGLGNERADNGADGRGRRRKRKEARKRAEAVNSMATSVTTTVAAKTTQGSIIGSTKSRAAIATTDESVYEAASRAGVDSSLLVHLTQRLGFRRESAIEALRAVGRIGETPTKEKEEEEDDDEEDDGEHSQSKLVSALDWLCVHLPESELTGAFSSRHIRKDVATVGSSRSFRSSGRRSDEGGVSVAGTYSFRNEAAIYRLCNVGFEHDIVKTAIAEASAALSSRCSADALSQWALVERLLPAPPKDWTCDADVSMDNDEIREARNDEFMALESIWGEEKVCRVIADTASTIAHQWKITIDANIPNNVLHRMPCKQKRRHAGGKETSSSQSGSGVTTLDVWISKRCRYPLEPPRFLLQDPRLAPAFALEVTREIVNQPASEHATMGEPCVYAVVEWVQEHLVKMARTWLGTHGLVGDEENGTGKKIKSRATTGSGSAKNTSSKSKATASNVSRHQQMKLDAKKRYKERAAREIEKTWAQYEKDIEKRSTNQENAKKKPPTGPAVVAKPSSAVSLGYSPKSSSSKRDKSAIAKREKAEIRRRKWADGLYLEAHPEMIDDHDTFSASSSSSSSDEEEQDTTAKHVASKRAQLPVPLTPSPLLMDIVGAIEETERLQPWLFKGDAASGSSTAATGAASTSVESDLAAKLERMKQQQRRMNEQLRRDHSKRQRGVAYKKMLGQRERLPAYQRREIIAKLIRNNQVCVVSGETGCGKTTQLPQIVLDDAIERGEGASCSIICTQPRRISAVGVAERVADERTERVGHTVGYQIRLESKRSRHTRLLFCTTGVLLRRLQCDADVRGISHIFIDEVHERDLNSDFLLIILKGILKRRPQLKLVLMSATLNADLFASYFGDCPTMDIPGRAFPVEAFYLEDAFELTGYVVRPGDDCAKRESRNRKRDDNRRGGGRGKGGRRAGMMRAVERATEESRNAQYGADDTSLVQMRRTYPASKYSTATLRSLTNVDETIINYELIEDLLRKLNETLPTGSVLIFLSGLMDITKLYDRLSSDHRGFGDPSKFRLHPLHSTLTTAEQKQIFERPPEGVRKIVISTNIAETSITIDDCVCVIDSGRVKENRYDVNRRMATLMQTWVSLASAKQRRGRAGRVRAGICYHLFSSETKNAMDDYTLPEMLRVPLDETVLQIKMLDLGAVRDFLGSAVNPPLPVAINDSLASLRSLNALDPNNGDALTPLGFHLATLPVSPRIGKMIVYGAIFKCLSPILTIAASLSFRSPFVAPLEKRDEADRAKRA